MTRSLAEKSDEVKNLLEEKGLPEVLAQQIATYYALDFVKPHLSAVQLELLVKPVVLKLSENWFSLEVDYIWAWRLPALSPVEPAWPQRCLVHDIERGVPVAEFINMTWKARLAVYNYRMGTRLQLNTHLGSVIAAPDNDGSEIRGILTRPTTRWGSGITLICDNW